MIEKTFANGNYNNWETFIRETLPLKNSLIREKLIPQIDVILESMLGVYSTIRKSSINVEPVFDEYITIRTEIIYNVEDFKAPDVPVEAVEKDETSILENLQAELTESEINVESIDIDVNTGELKIIASIALKF